MIIFFDGVCLMCNSFVDFLLKRDVERHFQFAPLQGARAKELVPPELHKQFNTVVLWSQGQVLTRSDAILTILTQLGGFWSLLRVFWIVPKPLRDLGYHLISTNRYRWWGKRDTCRLPTAEEKDRFLE